MAMTENSLRQPMRFVVDLSAGLVQQPIRPQLMKGDKQANTIIVKLKKDGEMVDLTGVEVTGSFISPVESAELPLPGEAVGDEARVTLLDQCYAEDGFFECSVKLKLGGTERTILSITGNVLSKGSGAYIDIGDVIPSIDDIIAQYAEMKRVTESAKAAAGSASTAAAKIDNMTVSAATGTSAGATISEKNGAKHISFTLPKGDKGDPGEVTLEQFNQLSEQMANYRTAVNLLDNSDFTNPVNQRGGGNGDYNWAYVIDRWMFNGNGFEFSGGIKIPAGGKIAQRLPNAVLSNTSGVTFAICLANGEIIIANNGTVTLSVGKHQTTGLVEVTIYNVSSAPVTVKWAALYEGAYTAETLPPYCPKGYNAELDVCRQYYFPSFKAYLTGCKFSETNGVMMVQTDATMRGGGVPDVICTTDGIIRYSDGVSEACGANNLYCADEPGSGFVKVSIRNTVYNQILPFIASDIVFALSRDL